MCVSSHPFHVCVISSVAILARTMQQTCDVVALVQDHVLPSSRTRHCLDVVGVVPACTARIHSTRWEVCKHARMCRKVKASEHVKHSFHKKCTGTVQHHNDHLAVRAVDVISTKVSKCKGKGGYKRWLPAAVLRCCFGHRVGEVRKKGKRKARPSGLHMAPRTVAEWFRSGHSHVQQVRNAVAETIVSHVNEQVESDSKRPGVRILEVSFDETKENIRCAQTVGSQHVLMCQARLGVQTPEFDFIDRDIICPTTVIQDTTAETLLSALTERLPMMLDFDKRCPYVLILNSDSAQSNIRLGKHFMQLCQRNGFLFLQSRCQMHMACASIVQELKYLDLTSPSFCATLQLHDGARMRALRDSILRYIRTNLRIVYERDKDWEKHREEHEAIVALVLSSHADKDDDSDEDAKATRPDRQKKRRAAAAALCELLPADWSLEDIIHFCPYGCCVSFEEAVCKIFAALDALLLSWLPRVPSLNKWTKLYQPLSWWCVSGQIHRIIPNCIRGLRAPDAPGRSINVGAIFECPTDEDIHRAVRLSRWKKTVAWLASFDTQCKLDLGVTVMQPALDIMGDIFTRNRKKISALDFAPWKTSPAAKSIAKYWRLLRSELDPFWLPFARREWTQEKYHMAFHGVLFLIGHIWLRMVLPFLEWPWPLAELANDKTSDARRCEIADAFWGACDRCLDSWFSKPFKRMARTREGVTSKTGITFLKNSFGRCPVNNVRTELQFGRGRNFMASCAGNVPDASTVASTHVVAEIAGLHKEYLKRKLPPDSEPTEKPPQNPRRQLCAWNNYVASMKGTGFTKDMKALGDQFSKMSEVERSTYMYMPAVADSTMLAPLTCEAVSPQPSQSQSRDSGTAIALIGEPSTDQNPNHVQPDTPLAIGSLRYPLAPHRLRDCCNNVSRKSTAWKTRTSLPHTGRSEILQHSDAPRCGELFGATSKMCPRQVVEQDDTTNRRFHEINNLLKKIAFDNHPDPFRVQMPQSHILSLDVSRKYSVRSYNDRKAIRSWCSLISNFDLWSIQTYGILKFHAATVFARSSQRLRRHESLHIFDTARCELEARDHDLLYV